MAWYVHNGVRGPENTTSVKLLCSREGTAKAKGRGMRAGLSVMMRDVK